MIAEALRQLAPSLVVGEEELAAAARGATGAHASERVLAALAAAGNASALAAIEALCAPIVEPIIRRFTSRDHATEDLRQILRTQLFAGSADKPPRIGEYSGTGALTSWVRVLATRTFIDLIRRKDRTREPLINEDDDEPAMPTDLELGAIKREHRAVVADALRAATGELPEGALHLLRQHFVLGASIDHIGAALGVHRATAARRLAAAREALVKATRESVAQRLAIPLDEVDEVCGLVSSGIDVSIRTMLASRK